jgi:NifB/MoaA-like Fe-S oxidoreductase
MRETLYFKDDDSRLSFLQGNFITLTNMSDEEIDRIIKYRLSPINVSVHTTNPDLRVKMLKNKNAGKVYEILKKFHQANLEINCQIVLVPSVNDGVELENTIEDLYKLNSTIHSVAIVPVGITKYRNNLEEIKPFNKETATELIKTVNSMQ